MRSQRVRDAEIRIEMQSVKWTTEGMVKGIAEYSMTHACVSCRGYDCILQRAYIIYETRWHRE